MSEEKEINTLQRYLETYKEANELLRTFGLAEQGWSFQIRRQKTFVGMCYHTKRVIAFSEYFLTSPKEQITDTLLHEIAHALVGPHHKHDHAWRAKAREIGAKPIRCPSASTTVSTASFNYVIKCNKCNKELAKRHRIKKQMYNAKCAYCKGPVTIYKYVR